jgi:LEA14-like dessication related protein
MKQVFEVLVLILFFSFISQTTKAQPFADIQFERMDYSFGKIKEEGGLATYSFRFTNTGKIPLIIQDVQASCGCTTPEWSAEPILPGKMGFIKVSFNPELRPGIFTKSISIHANVPNSPRVLTLSGEVIPRVLNIEDIFPFDFGKIRIMYNEIPFMKIKEIETKTDTLYFYNQGTAPVSVQFKIIPPHIKIKTIPEIVQPKSKGYFLITFDATKKQAYGYVTNRIYLSFNNEEKYDFAFKVSGIIEEDFSQLSATDLANAPQIDYNSRTFDFGEIPEGKKVDYTFKIANKGKRALIIRNVTTSCDCTAGQPVSNTIQPGGSTEMKVSFDSSGKVGLQNKIITVICNDPKQSTTVLRVTGTVRR